MKPNDKVICINDQFRPEHRARHSSLPIKGQTYAVREVGTEFGQLGIRLVGINGRTRPQDGSEYGFLASRFRLLSELKAEAAAKAKQLQTK